LLVTVEHMTRSFENTQNRHFKTESLSLDSVATL